MVMVEPPTADVDWHSLPVDEVLERVGVDPASGLDAGEVQRRLAQYGRNEVAGEPPPTLWAVAKGQLSNPMNIMLLIVERRQLGDRPGGDRRRSCWRWCRST